MSLVDFAKELRMKEKRARCPVCKLSEEHRMMLAQAGADGITRKEQVMWLEQVVGMKTTVGELAAHFAGRHDD